MFTKRYLLILTAFLLSAVALAQAPKFVEAHFLYSKFYSPIDGPYVETYLSVKGNSVSYVKLDNGKFQGKVAVSIVFSQDSTVVNFDKYEILSPEIADTSNVEIDFLDQQRFSLPNGTYTLAIQIYDVNSDYRPKPAEQIIDLDFPKDKINLSSIQLVESYTKTTEENVLSKSGYDLVPYVYNYLPAKARSLSFYSEIYNADKDLGADGQYLINYYLESYETGKKLNKFTSFKREQAKAVNILFANFNITELPTGNYRLIVEVRNRNNEALATNKLFFQRNNPDYNANYLEYAGVSSNNSFVDRITSVDTLRQYIDYIIPISTDMELNFINYQIDKGDADLEVMQRFFFNFWLDRDDLNPEYAWKQYLSSVDLVNEQFSAPGKKGTRGYKTDMGRVFLKYGPPNTITDRPFDASTSGMSIGNDSDGYGDAGVVPYQIWHYYTIESLNQRNCKFVFANIHIALNDYKLIHSNVPGEIYNANWQAELHYRFQHGTNMPDQDNYGGKSGEYYNNPR
jgi:GWxTD domain-containing protein